MTTAVFDHPACLEHDTGFQHPESPERLRAVLEALAKPEFSSLVRRTAHRVHRGQLLRVHDGEYVSGVLADIPQSDRIDYEPTGTVLSPGSGEAALRAAGALCAAVDAVAAGEVDNAFCAVRPPGHHAEPSRTMGFCLFNNIAVGALHARIAHRFQRIAVIDFDVHHGNGTQAMFEGDPDLFFASTHQSFLFPATGREDERGIGNIVNVPLARGWGKSEFRREFSTKVVPEVAAFKPEFIFISAGFDALIADPIGSLRLSNDDLAWATTEVAALARTHCSGRLVSALEGGYNPHTLGRASAAHVKALMAA